MEDVFIFQTVTDEDLLKATLFNHCELAENGCWVWKRGHFRAGYGLIWHEGKTWSAHRLAFTIFKGAIPSGKVLCHSCDNPACINPNHLRAGTHQDNARDREARGRRIFHGEIVGTSRLTTEQVLEIKVSKEKATILAAKYGVDKSHIWGIRAGRYWRHLNKAAEEIKENT